MTKKGGGAVNGPFERYGEIHQIKQQLHVRELQMNGQLERQRANLYKRNQAGDENWEQLKFTLGAWRAWAKEKTKAVSAVKKGKGDKEVRTKTPAEVSDFAGEEMSGEVTAESRQRTTQLPELKKMQSALQEERCTGTSAENRGSTEGMNVTDLMELQRAVLWAEILGEPVSKRRRAKRFRAAEGKR